MFLPTTREEMNNLGWKSLDVIIVTGDTYIDSPYIGAAVIGKTLFNAGYKVGIIAQPDINSETDITRLGEPDLFWGVTGGSVDSMVANYTPLKKPRKSDDFTPGGENNRRPDRAVIAYCNLIRRFFKETKPLVIGGIEASLRRIAHYDYWDNKIRRPILFDAKADVLIYGMGETAVTELALCFRENMDFKNVRGICYASKEIPRSDYLQLPSYDDVVSDKLKFIDMFNIFYQNNDPLTAKGLYQKNDIRYLIQNPPAALRTGENLDRVFEYGYEYDVHPYYKKDGHVKALETIKFSITTHRGCYGECNFCAIAVHQGRTICERSVESILHEAEKLVKLDGFKGYILDAGGPTANMYGIECDKKIKFGACKNKRCLYPEKCKQLDINHKKQVTLLKKLREITGIKKVFVASGIRHDMIMSDQTCRDEYLRELLEHHVSGQLKIAPEHTENQVLCMMGKPGKKPLVEFRMLFMKFNKEVGDKRQFLTYYLIAAHPGSTELEMRKMQEFVSRELKIKPEQVQIFTPTPSTYSTLMYYTEMDPFTKKKIFVEKNPGKKDAQKRIITG